MNTNERCVWILVIALRQDKHTGWSSKVLAFIWVWLHKVTGIMFLLFSSGCTWAFFVWDWLHIGIGLFLGLHAHVRSSCCT